MKTSNLLAILAFQIAICNTAVPGELTKNWGLDRTHVSSTWNMSQKRQIRVAVIDTGVDVGHVDLKNRICPPKGDEYGWDFVENHKNPIDRLGHGTHVAGIVRSVSASACIIPIRYFSDTASGATNLANTVKAIDYAVDRGAQIINYSGGGAEFSAAEMRVIQRAEARGVLFVAAAGNEWRDTEIAGNAYFPAMYGLSNIIVVTGTQYKGGLLPSSNWGVKHVHIAAPGQNIYSTLPKNKYGYMTGTSQATPFVSGIAAVILSRYPKLQPHEVRRVILESVDVTTDLKSKVVSGGTVNALKAMNRAEEIYSHKTWNALR